MATARFSYTIVYVPDVAAATAFYRAAFGCSVRFADQSGDYAELDTGDVTLAFASEELAARNLPAGYQRHELSSPPAATELAFITEDISGVIAQATAAGASIVTEPVKKPWGQTVAYLRDPNGVLIEIGSPVGT